jgi:hypothetical protein
MVKNYESPILTENKKKTEISSSSKLIKQNVLDNILAFSKSLEVQFTNEKEPIFILKN